MTWPENYAGSENTATVTIRVELGGSFVDTGICSAFSGDGDSEQNLVDGNGAAMIDRGDGEGTTWCTLEVGMGSSPITAKFKYKATDGTIYNLTFNGGETEKELSPNIPWGGIGADWVGVDPIIMTAVAIGGGNGGGGSGAAGTWPENYAGSENTATVTIRVELGGSFVDTGICSAFSGDGDTEQNLVDGNGAAMIDRGDGEGTTWCTLEVGMGSSPITAKFKYKATDGSIYNLTFNGGETEKELSPNIPWGGIGADWVGVDPIIMTAVATGGGGGPTTPDAPVATGLTIDSVTVVQGGDITTTDKLSEMFTGDDITYSYSYTEDGVATGDVSAVTSGDYVKISATSGATPGSGYVVTVTATNGGGSAPKTIPVTVEAANQGPVSAGEFQNITVGKSLKGGTLYVENFKSKFSDPDGDTLTYDITSSATSVCTASESENGNNIDLVFQDGMDTGESTITVIARDVSGSNTPFTKTFTVSIVDPKKVYVWTVSELQNETMTTVIKMQIVDTTISIPGVHLKYTLTDEANYASKPAINSSYQQSANNPWSADSAIHTKGWAHQLINATTPGKEYIVLFDSASKKLSSGSYDLMYFTGVKFDIEIIGLSDQYGNIISYDDVENQAPPTIFEDTTVDPVTGQKYGDVNVDDLVNDDDVAMLSRYLVRDNREYEETTSGANVQAITKIETEIAAFPASVTGTYVSLGQAAGGVEGSTGKAFSHIDVDKDGIISVADLCRLAEALENGSYNIIG
jgi:hypothetical protein